MSISSFLSKRTLREIALRVSAHPPLSKLLSFRGPAAARRVALSFDDGPNPEFTPVVLDTLARTGVRATFFLLGRQIERYPGLVRRIRDAGHEIGIHGYDHTSRDLPAQARRTRALLLRHGVSSRLFRPPRGRLGPRDGIGLALGGFRIVLWSFDARDSMRAEGKARGPVDYGGLAAGDILLLHDDNPICAGELGDIIANLRSRGLEPGPVSDLSLHVVAGDFLVPGPAVDPRPVFVRVERRVDEKARG